jgi:hypothetical protein
MPIIEFANEYMPTNAIDLEDLGNFYLQAVDEDKGLYYYIMCRTSLGTSTIMQYGPVVPDIELLPSSYQCKLERIKYDINKMIKYINNWINDFKKHITSACIIDKETFENNFKNLIDYMNSYSDEVY